LNLFPAAEMSAAGVFAVGCEPNMKTYL